MMSSDDFSFSRFHSKSSTHPEAPRMQQETTCHGCPGGTTEDQQSNQRFELSGSGTDDSIWYMSIADLLIALHQFQEFSHNLL